MSNPVAPPNHVSLNGYHLGESAKAVKFSVHQVNGDELPEPVVGWYPFSQTKSITTDRSTSEFDCIVVTKWIAEQKGLV